MIFYDKDRKPYAFDISKEDYFDKGTTSKIYRIGNNECLKVMNRDPSNCFDEYLFNRLKMLSLDGLVKLGTPFYIDGDIKAYTMDYLEKSKRSILDFPIEYILDNLDRLYKDILVLTKNLILTIDLYYRNLIIGESKMTIIDFDKYLRLSYDNDILYRNTSYLLYSFKKHYENALNGIDIYTKTIVNMKMTASEYLDYLFDYTGYKEEPSMVLKRKIADTRTMWNYLIENGNK